MGTDFDTLKKHAVNLKQSYDTLFSVHLEYLDVANEHADNTYMTDIDVEYTNVIQQYHSSRKESEEIERKEQAAPLYASFNSSKKRVNKLIIDLEKDLACETSDLDSLVVTKEHIEADIASLVASLSKLGMMGDTTEEEKEINGVLDHAKGLGIQVEIKMRKSRACRTTVENKALNIDGGRESGDLKGKDVEDDPDSQCLVSGDTGV